MKQYANATKCNNKTPQKYSKLYDINGNILTYNSDKSNKEWILYNDNIFKKYPKAIQQDIKCNI
jgi:hypothetical protein